ncbi:hypothetical protein [Engelhardtia mirabilis]|uniref:HEAT repeat protein n=1 Tax=Engelhardtia mirabilis TaxID=2528011 RepID=A0A518BK09_9BACT|nr:hypothetical protein Pla133_23850 [Planctomycetes bacterium Pla133]QDV01631.1 hypothetical protein Pla86_23840 [Planctomycetes bacterium Pla86]
MTSPSALSRRLVATLLVAGCWSTVAQVGAADSSTSSAVDTRTAQAALTPHDLEVLRVLRAQREAGHSIDAGLALELTTLCADDPRAAVRVLLDGNLPATEVDPQPQAINRYQESMALAALAASDRGRVRSALPPAAQWTEALQPRLVRILGACSQPETIGDVVRAAKPESLEPAGIAVEDVSRATRDALRAAIGQVLGRGLGHLDRLEAELAGLSDHLALSVLAGLGDVGSGAALPLLSRQLAQRSSVQTAVLNEIARCAPSVDRRLDDEVARAVLRLLDPQDPHLSTAAIRALGALRSLDAVDDLVQLLTSDGDLAEQAHRALVQISGSSLPANADLWRERLEVERNFEKRGLNSHLHALQDASIGDLAAHLRALDGHFMARDAIAEQLSLLLLRDEVLVRRAACVSLGRTGSVQGLKPLAALLDESTGVDNDLAGQARDALISIAGTDLGPTAGDWLDWLSEQAPQR